MRQTLYEPIASPQNPSADIPLSSHPKDDRSKDDFSKAGHPNGRLSETQVMLGGSAISLRAALLAILLVSVALRVASAWYQGNEIDTLPGVWDQVSYHGLAQRVLAGDGFSFGEQWWPATRPNEPTAHWSYLYTLYLTGVYGLAGVQPLLARVLQAVIVGVLHPLLAYRIGKRVFNPITGLLAAAFSSIYIYFFYYGGALVTETMYITSVLWMVDCALRIAAEPNESSSRRWWELGLAIGIAALFRQLILLFVPFLYLWIWWRLGSGEQKQNLPSQTDSATIQSAYTKLALQDSGLRRWQRMFRPQAFRGFVFATVLVCGLILPWTARNYMAFGTLTPLNTNAGYVLFWGNHPIYGTEFVGILPSQTSYYDLIPKDLLPLNEAQLDQALLKRGLSFITEDPQRYIWLSISRIKEYFKFWPTADSGTLSNLSRVGSFGVFLPLMVYGLWAAFVRYRHELSPEQRSAALLLGLFMLVYTGIHLLTWALVRYRLPVDAVLLLFAGFAFSSLLRRLQGTQS